MKGRMGVQLCMCNGGPIFLPVHKIPIVHGVGFCVSKPQLKKGQTKTSFPLCLFDTLWCDRLALEEGDVSVFLESEEEEPRLTSSLLTIPTYIKV